MRELRVVAAAAALLIALKLLARTGACGEGAGERPDAQAHRAHEAANGDERGAG